MQHALVVGTKRAENTTAKAAWCGPPDHGLDLTDYRCSRPAEQQYFRQPGRNGLPHPAWLAQAPLNDR